jgi:signal transduction histidine kinase/PAS domain-containing protein
VTVLPTPPTRTLLAPDELQERVRLRLDDPDAELLIWCGNPVWAYADVRGERRELEAADGRVVTPIDRDGSRLAALVHEEPLSEDAEPLEQVAASVGLEIERDRFLFELERSERRNRALLEAIPDKMFRVRRDGIILDIQENPDHSTTPTDVNVGSSAYDAPVPREVIDRVMEAGRLALETGELQTFEWQRRVVTDLRYLEGRFIPSGDDEFILVVRDVTERKRHEVEQEALHRVALAVAADGRPERIFDLVAEEVGRVLEADSANLLRYDSNGAGSEIVGRWSEPGVLASPVGRRVPMENGTVAHRIYTTGLPVRFDLDDGTEEAFAKNMRKIGANSVVAAPIVVTGHIWGAMTARLTPPHVFPKGAKKRLEKFAGLVSLALANEEARDQLAASRARLVTTADEERRRLERNLHDGAQQRLVSLSLTLRHAQTELADDPTSAAELLAAATAELDVALEELRELARGIHPAVLTERGLEAALQTLADRSPVAVDIEVFSDRRFPRHVEAAAYYLVSESLTNVAKYAAASCVTVRIAEDNGSAVVEVVDDGIGGADPLRGSGLRGLNDRIEALDGTLTIDSRPGEGTTIRATIPA